MADKIFHTGFLEKVAPVGADKVMISDSEAMNQTKFTDIANLPISTATSTAIGVVQSDIDTHEARTDNPHSVTKSQVGLSNVDNTTDASKPISTATQTALNAKQDTITGLTASGAELNILDGATLSTTELNYVDGVTSPIQTQIDAKANLTGGNTFTGINTFSSSPIVPIPTTAEQAVNKEYADYTPNFYQYSITRTIVGGILTLGLNNYEGNNPTVAKPVKAMVNGAVRTITSTVTTTLAGGTNIFDLGGAELAGKEVELFVYLIDNGGAITISCARKSFGIVREDFNTAFLTNINFMNGLYFLPAGTPVKCIGRFNIILSGSPYTWSIPATSIISNDISSINNSAISVPKVFMSTGGNVGINTTAPSEKLHVVGNEYITGNIELGHASDTTLSRASAGRIAVEGATVAHQNDITQNTRQDLALALTPNYDAINGAIVLDSSKNHYHGTVSGATYVPNGGLNGGGAYDFDGVDDYIELNDGMTIKSTSIATESGPAGLCFSTDFTQMYNLSSLGDTIYQYTLSIPGDVTTKTLVGSKSITTEDTNASGIRFSPDGLKMYMTGIVGQDVTYYTLSTAWDITTLSVVGTFSVAGQETSPRDIEFKPDGTKFYIVGLGSDSVNQYSLSTAWDMSTASYDSVSLSVVSQESDSQALKISSDGTKLFVMGSIGDDVNEYSLSTPWVLTGGTFTGVTFYVGTQENVPSGLWFSDDGRTLYIIGSGSNSIYQYNLYSAYSFSNPMYSNGFTIIADINPEIASGRIIDKTYDNNSAVTGHQAYISASGAVDYRVNAGGVISSGTGKFPLATMKRLVITVSSLGAGIIYSNGVSVASGTTGLPSTLTVSAKTRIGNGAGRTDSPYGGNIGQVRIISRVLTATEIANDYLQRTEIDNPPEVPRLTTAMRGAMTPSLGQQVYNTTTNKAQVYNGAWNDLY